MCDPQQPQCMHANKRQRHSIAAPPSDAMLQRTSLDVHLLRHSVPILSAQDAPESILMRTGVRFVGIALRDDHCVYSLQISTLHDTHIIHKSFSDFRDFRKELINELKDRKSHCGAGPCAQLEQLEQVKFPHRRLHWPTRERKMVVAQERLVGLERFMLTTLCVYRIASRRHVRLCVNAQCRVATMIKRFLQVADAGVVPAGTGAPFNNQQQEEELPPAVDVDVSMVLRRLSYDAPLQPKSQKITDRRSENYAMLVSACGASE